VHLHRRAADSRRGTCRCPRTGLICRGTPPAAGRAWVPGCRARTLPPVTPFYDGSAVLNSPGRWPIRDLDWWPPSHAL